MAKKLPESFSIKDKITISKMGILSQRIFDAIRNNPMPEGFHNFIQFTVSELFMNIKEHSKSKSIEINFVLGEKGKFKLSLRDFGIGFYKSYQQNGFYPKNSVVAINWAVNGLSTKDTKERGFGLFSINKLVSALNGMLILSSDNSIIKMRNGTGTTKNSNKKINGCSVVISADIKELDFYKIIN